MVSFLFWNLARKPLRDRVTRLASTHSVDILMLTECAIEPADLLSTLNDGKTGPYCLPFSGSKKLHIFSRLPESDLTEELDNPLGAWTIRQLRVGGITSLLLAVAHLPSKMDWDVADQATGSTELVYNIGVIETKLAHRRTILVGDLNMNPFDPGLVQARNLHAVMTRDLARRGERVVRGKRFPFFYNPMWGLFGDRTHGPPGTFYLRSSKPGNYFWNMYDQVLLRPDLMDSLVDLEILASDGNDSLLTERGRPDRSDGSDHLPIFFRLDI